jgi:hypothetical protein
MERLFSLRACVVVGVVGLLICSVMVGISFYFIQQFLFDLNVEALVVLPTFYSFLLSFAGFGGSVVLITKKPSSSSSCKKDVDSSSKLDVSSKKVGSSGASEFVTLLPGTKLQNESGTTIELSEPYILWPKFAKSVVPEEPKKQVVAKRRFFMRVED